MANIDKILRKKRQHEAQGMRDDFQKKILQAGDNKFRAVGDITFVFEHWFIAADGTPVHSYCTKDEEGKGECEVCKEYLKAFQILNSEEGDFTKEEIEKAEITVGDKPAENQKYPSSWKAREFAYINIIDRDDNWCKENKKTKILSKSSSQPGISSGKGGIFDEIIDVVDEHGDYEDNTYDIRIKKSGKNTDTSYRGYRDKVVALTKEEKSYESYNLEDITKPTPSETLKLWLETGVKGDKKKKDEDKKEEKKEDKKKRFVTKVKKKEEVKPEPEEKTETVEMAECPECSEEIPIDSSSCPHCQSEFCGFEDEESDV